MTPASIRQNNKDCGQLLDRHVAEIVAMGKGATEAEVLTKPLMLNSLFSQVFFVKRGFELKFVEQVTDDIEQEREISLLS